MTAALQKELRSLRPAWLAALGLTALPFLAFLAFQLQGFSGGFWESQTTWNICLYFGGVLLGSEILGREFTHHTFQSLLTTPISRQQVWKDKWTPLAWTSTSILLLQLLLWYVHSQFGGPHYDQNEWLIGAVWKTLLTLCAISNGLFWILLTRQTIGAIWLSLATPGLLAISLDIILTWAGIQNAENLAWWIAVITITALSQYAARQLFIRAQDMGSSQLDLLDCLIRPSKTTASRKSGPTHPLIALLRKELALHQLNLILVAGFTLVLLILVAALDWLPLETQHRSDLREYSQMLWFLLWPCVPFIIGATAYAEERRLRLDVWQSVQPVSMTQQWFIKWFTTLLVSLLLGVLLPLTLELTLLQGSYVEEFGPDLREYLIVRACSWLCGTTLGFYASSLSRSLVQAISAAIGITIGCVVLFLLATLMVSKILFLLQFEIYSPNDLQFLTLVTTLLLGWPMLTALSRLNHRSLQLRPEYRRYNIAAFGLLAILTLALPTLVIDRSWERLKPTPAPLPPIPVKAEVQPNFALAGGILAGALTPDGSLWGWWTARYQEGNTAVLRVSEAPHPIKLHADNNWTSIAGNWKGLYAIRADGSLWRFSVRYASLEAIAAGPKPLTTGLQLAVKPERLNVPGDWKAITASDRYLAGLQSDGSLWVWGSVMIKTAQGITMPSEEPVRVGTQSGFKSVAANASEILTIDSTGHAWKWITPLLSYGYSIQAVPSDLPKIPAAEDKTPTSPLPILSDFTFTQVHNTDIANYGIQPDGTVRDLNSGRVLSRNPLRSAHMNSREGYFITSNGILLSLLPPTPYQLTADSITPDSAKRQLTTRTDWIAVGKLAIPGSPSAMVGMTADGVLWQWNRWQWPGLTDHLGLPSHVHNNSPQPFASLAGK